MAARRNKTGAVPPRGRQQLRIIGGHWRGRRLDFADLPGLRPTPDRVRETLFNWLQGVIQGSHCLDLFAGSGALGLEAASRGAARVVAVDSNVQVYRQLCAHAERLQCPTYAPTHQDALAYLELGSDGFDIVFLDPPFKQGLLQQSIDRLAQSGWLKPGAYIYLEAEVDLPAPRLPDDWTLLRSKQAGAVAYALARRAIS